MTTLGLREVATYLRAAGWSLEDQDDRTTLWRVTDPPDAESLEIVLPVRHEVSDYQDRIDAALRTLAYAEKRLPDELRSDIGFGGADTVAVRLTPDATPGEAPLSLAHSAASALYSLSWDPRPRSRPMIWCYRHIVALGQSRMPTR